MGGQGVFRMEAPVRPMRVAARVEIPGRKAGETRLSGASKRGGAPLKADVRRSPGCLFSRTAGLNVPLYQVDLHVGCLRVILAWGGGVAGAGAACLGLWRRMSCYGLALDVGLPALLVRPTEHRAVSSLSRPSLNMSWSGWFRSVACAVLPLEGSEVVPRWIFACPSDIFVSFGQPKCWRDPCAVAWLNAALPSLGFLPALTDAVPSASSVGLCPADFGRSLVRIIALIRRLSCRCRGTQIVFFRAVVDSTIANISVRSVVSCRRNASPIV